MIPQLSLAMEAHDVLTQEEYEFEMALNSFNFDDLILRANASSPSKSPS
nr:hypothetical protein Iba_chr07cCG13200 [Ipomoea batatas]